MFREVRKKQETGSRIAAAVTTRGHRQAGTRAHEPSARLPTPLVPLKSRMIWAISVRFSARLPIHKDGKPMLAAGREGQRS